ncbi:TPA: hypothetical protein JGA48_002667 [Salmonella enterica]|nr:hypothetical protein [Salmonella enterica]
MVVAERITHFYRQYSTHDGTVIELDTGKDVFVLETLDEVQRRVEQAQKDN